MLNPLSLPAEGVPASPCLPAEGVALYLMPPIKGFADPLLCLLRVFPSLMPPADLEGSTRVVVIPYNVIWVDESQSDLGMGNFSVRMWVFSI